MFRRRNYFINKKFQLGFLARFVLLLVLESVLIAGLFLYISDNTLTTGYSNSILRVERTSDFFFISFALITLIVVIGLGMIGMVVFILLSHRIAGPLYRFEKTLQEVGNGDLTTRVHLRKTDQITELRESLNELIDSLDKRMDRVKNGLMELKVLLSKKNDPGAIARINSVIDALEDDIEHFTVTSDRKE